MDVAWISFDNHKTQTIPREYHHKAPLAQLILPHLGANQRALDILVSSAIDWRKSCDESCCQAWKKVDGWHGSVFPFADPWIQKPSVPIPREEGWNCGGIPVMRVVSLGDRVAPVALVTEWNCFHHSSCQLWTWRSNWVPGKYEILYFWYQHFMETLPEAQRTYKSHFLKIFYRPN